MTLKTTDPLAADVTWMRVWFSTLFFATLDVVDTLLCHVFAVFDYFAGEPWEHCRYCAPTSVDIPVNLSESRSRATDHTKNGEFTDRDRISFSLARSPSASTDEKSSETPALSAHNSTQSFNRICSHFHTDNSISHPQFHSDLGLCHPSPTLARVKSLACNRVLGHLRFNPDRPKSQPEPHRVSRHPKSIRWSDCHCADCISWEGGNGHLFVHAQGGIDETLDGGGSSPGTQPHPRPRPPVIFLHGFLASSSFWTDTVLPHLPPTLRLVAVDLLGFGRSPKPISAQYTIADHLEAISSSVDLTRGGFHVVGHSMGCILAVALAAAHPKEVKSVVLIAPPSVAPSQEPSPSAAFLHQIAPRHVSSVLHLGIAVMAWYEHVGRLVCALLCCGHRVWDPLLKAALPKLARRSVPPSFVSAFSQHTHHSAWHTFHNTICGGQQVMHNCLQTLQQHGVVVHVIHGRDDVICRPEGSDELAGRHANVRTWRVEGDHVTCVLGREKELARELETIWLGEME